MPTRKATSKKASARMGRPPLAEGVDTLPVTIRMTPDQKDKLQRLGGPPWVRDRIDKAREPGDKE